MSKVKKESKFRKFIQQHFMIIVVFAIMLIPSIYTVLFLGSMWDPYGNTGSLPVAVVNQDEAVIYGGKEVAVGDQLVDNLKKNDSLQFNFVDEQVALDGLENGTFYMVMIIPKDFSYNSTTLTTDNPRRMEMQYYTNPGTNYIASKFGESAVKTIKENLNKTVIKTYADTIYGKLNTIGNGFQEAADGSGQIYDGVGTLKNGNMQITNGLDTLTNGCLTLKEGTGTLADGLKAYTDGVSQVNAGAKELYSGTQTLVSNNAALNDGAQQLLDGLNYMSDSLGESLTPEVIAETPAKLDKLTSVLDQAQELLNKYELDDETKKELQNSINELNTFVNSKEFETLYNFVNKDIVDWDKVITTIDAIDTSKLPQEARETLETLKTLANKMKKIQELEHKISEDDIKKSVGTVNSLVNSNENKIDINNVINESKSSVNSIKSMFNGLVEIQNGLDRTKEKDGETGLIEGMTTLSGGIKEYTSGVSQVNNGAKQLVEGTNTLVKNNKKLNSGVKQLDGGAVQLYDGSQKLHDGTLQINDGCDKLMLGANTLKTSLLDGAKQIENTNTGESAAEMFSQPVETNETFQRTINSNGEAMSAYMMCAGLWVACLAFCLMFSPFKTSLKKRETFIGHVLIAGFVAVVQAVLMVTLIMAIDGMRPAHTLETYLMAILASLAFMSIVYFLNTLLDSIGSFILLVFLCMQLSGAAGTYPINLSPKFYQIIHPFMPFTYGVDAFRSTISTGNSLATDIAVFAGIFLVCSLLTCLVYEIRHLKSKKERHQLQELEREEEIEYYNTQQV